ncbi:hypothetical protein Syun_022193 [Stephania yunnanensis]|uniref:Uncharacterized protein n=1 Tax=Stephania yunnanensis TaxID=152371 RepID=A0AAP0IIH2_9MAGN
MPRMALCRSNKTATSPQLEPHQSCNPGSTSFPTPSTPTDLIRRSPRPSPPPSSSP